MQHPIENSITSPSKKKPKKPIACLNDHYLNSVGAPISALVNFLALFLFLSLSFLFKTVVLPFLLLTSRLLAGGCISVLACEGLWFGGGPARWLKFFKLHSGKFVWQWAAKINFMFSHEINIYINFCSYRSHINSQIIMLRYRICMNDNLYILIFNINLSC